MRWYLLLALFLALFMSACASKPIAVDEPASKISTPERVRAIETAHNYLGVQINDFEDWLNGVSDPIPRAEVIARARTIRLAFDAETKAIEPLAPAVAKDTKKAISLEKQVNSLQDPARASLRNWGILGVVIGVGMVGLYFAAGFIPVVGPWIEKRGKFFLFGALAVIAIGFTLITLARFLSQIEWIIAGTLGTAFLSSLAIGGWYLWIHHKDYLEPWPEPNQPLPPSDK